MNTENLNYYLLQSTLKCEQLKSMDVINDYDIKLRKENERLCLDDGVTEFDAVMDIKLHPKKTIQTIVTNFTVTKSGSNFTDNEITS